MKEILLLKDGEIVLKGLNRRQFEDALKRNIKHSLSDLGRFDISSAQSTIYLRPLSDDIDLDEACDRVSRIFGIVSFSRAAVCPEKTLESVLETAPVYLEKSAATRSSRSSRPRSAARQADFCSRSSLT